MLLSLNIDLKKIPPFSLLKWDSNTTATCLGWRKQNGMECSKLTDFTIWGEDLALFIISLGSLHLMKVLNHSAQLVSEMVDYRGSSSKLQEQDPFSLSFEETARIIPASSNGRETGKSKCNGKYKQSAISVGSHSCSSALPSAEGWPFLSFTSKGQLLPGPCRYESEVSVA